MKFLFTSLLVPFLLFNAMAQEKAEGAIYGIKFCISEELITIYSASTDRRNILSGFSQMEDFPDYLKDSVMNLAERTLSAKFNANVLALRPEKRTMDMAPEYKCLDNLPVNTLNRILKQERKYDKYFEMSFYVSAEAPAVTAPKLQGKKRKLKPIPRLAVVVFDQTKKKIWEKGVALQDYGKLQHTEQKNAKGTTVKEFETLTSDDIYDMYVRSMNELFKDENKQANE